MPPSVHPRMVMVATTPPPYVEKVLTVTKAPQTITFGALTNARPLPGTYSLDGKATASSESAVSYASSG